MDAMGSELLVVEVTHLLEASWHLEHSTIERRLRKLNNLLFSPPFIRALASVHGQCAVARRRLLHNQTGRKKPLVHKTSLNSCVDWHWHWADAGRAIDWRGSYCGPRGTRFQVSLALPQILWRAPRLWVVQIPSIHYSLVVRMFVFRFDCGHQVLGDMAVKILRFPTVCSATSHVFLVLLLCLGHLLCEFVLARKLVHLRLHIFVAIQVQQMDQTRIAMVDDGQVSSLLF